MKYPTLEPIPTKQQITESFGGYNHNLKIGDGEFYDMKNLTSDYFPILSPRSGRKVYTSVTAPGGIIAKDAVCYVDGSELVINEYRVDMKLSPGKKQLVSMGAYLLIFPDKKYISTLDLTDWGGLEAEYESQSTVNFSLCTIDGSDIENTIASPIEPKSPESGQYWIDTSSKPHSLKKYGSDTWVSIATTYIKISCIGIGKKFSKFDGVQIKGVTAEGLEGLNATATIYAVSENYIVVVGITDMIAEQTEPITVSRKVPIMDYVTEAGNRLWGCRYGQNNDGKVVNEIYACKLNDFKNWQCFPGIASDSYYVSVGTDGPFTGAITYLGDPHFFKENCVHRVYGDEPSNYKVQATTLRGVQKGCSESMAIVNETLFYKSRSGVCVYTGALPSEVSKIFGTEKYNNAVGAAHENKYYISMQDSHGEWNLFVYDLQKSMWHKEDNFHADSFCSNDGVLYAIENGTGKIWELNGSDMSIENVEWMAETGNIGLGDPNKKYISRLTVRMWLDIGAKVDFDAKYDNGKKWEHLMTIKGTSLRTVTFPCKIRRCDHLKIRIRGSGRAKVYSIVKTIERGSAG